MNTIKKDYVELVKFLEANKGKKVSTILEEVKSMCSKKTNDKTFKVDEEGNVTHVFCYYHKQWEEVGTYEYGPKKSTASKLNTMCKEGVSSWTKQQRIAKKEKEQLLVDLSSEVISVEDLPRLQQEIEDRRTTIIPHSNDSE